MFQAAEMPASKANLSSPATQSCRFAAAGYVVPYLKFHRVTGKVSVGHDGHMMFDPLAEVIDHILVFHPFDIDILQEKQVVQDILTCLTWMQTLLKKKLKIDLINIIITIIIILGFTLVTAIQALVWLWGVQQCSVANHLAKSPV